jgi:tetratricopeptide (TPR) repeat protein
MNRTGLTGGAFRILGILACLIGNLAFAGYEHGTQGPYSYYTSDPQELALRRSAELHHIGPAVEKMQRRDYRGALGDLEFILNKFPNHPRALQLLADFAVNQLKRPEIAETRVQRAVDFDPSRPGTHLVVGLIKHKLGKQKEAIDSYSKAIALDPDQIDAHYNLGLAYVATKDYTRANEHAQRAYALGHPLPGLRDRLKQVGAWKALPQEEPEAPPATADGTPTPVDTTAPK